MICEEGVGSEEERARRVEHNIEVDTDKGSESKEGSDSIYENVRENDFYDSLRNHGVVSAIYHNSEHAKIYACKTDNDCYSPPDMYPIFHSVK